VGTIIAVHGTFSHGGAEGDQWWQKGSLFEQELAKYIVSANGNPIDLCPLLWDGQNSESSRRNAADTLATTLRTKARDGSSCVVVGHSHGGSVVVNAALDGIRLADLKYVSSVVTIGTPYLQFAKMKFIFSRSSLLAKSALASLAFVALGSFLMLGPEDSHLYNHLVGQWVSTNYWTFTLARAAICFAPLAIVYAILRIIDNRRYRRYRRFIGTAAHQDLSKKWICLYDKNDEAIGGLALLRDMRTQIFPARFAVPFLSFLAIFALPLILIVLCATPSAMLLLSRMLSDVDEYGASLVKAAGGQDFEGNVSFLANAGYMLLTKLVPSSALTSDELSVAVFYFFGLVPLLFFCASFVATYAAILFSVKLSEWTGWALDHLTWKAIRKTAFGADTIGEVAQHASTAPNWLVTRFNSLPTSLSNELNDFSNAAASESIPHLRKLLSQLASFDNAADPNRFIEDYLTWNELVHTSYFAVPRFRKFLCYLIARTDGFKPSKMFEEDPDYALLAQWSRDIEPEVDAASALGKLA
jgi:pimeloyl-ACP methyl ester carboxylesterase